MIYWIKTDEWYPVLSVEKEKDNWSDSIELTEEQVDEILNLITEDDLVEIDTITEEQIEEASYSAKAARAGKDIGKPGKNFEKIAKKAGEKYGSEERGRKVAGAILAKLRSK